MKIICVFMFILAAVHCTEFHVSNVFGDNMVLQRSPHSAVIHGFSAAKDSITVTLGSTTVSGVIDESGIWEVKLPPQPAGGPFTIKVASGSGGSAVLSNVMFGDVWVCSGQSNMQLTVVESFNGTEESLKASNYPQIRVLTVGNGNTSLTPVPELLSLLQPWAVASPSSIGGPYWAYFSAVCWFFGKDLADSLGPDVPIGLISSNWGGTVLQAWSSPDVLTACNVTSAQKSPRFQIKAYPDANHIEADPNPNTDSVLYNAMIVPFMRSPIAGAVWYQGESNIGQTALYSCLFPKFISDWRSKWAGNWNFPFLFVQLAAWTSGPGTGIAEIRDAQLSALSLPSVGFATAIDTGDLASPMGDVHPRDKQTPASRLSLAARAIAYADQKAVWQGPRLMKASIFSPSPPLIQMWFDPDTISGGLKLHKTYCPATLDAANCAWYSILLSDGKWYNATSYDLPTSGAGAPFLEVQLWPAPAGLTPKGIRYGYGNWPVCTLYNGVGLPAIPFSHLF